MKQIWFLKTQTHPAAVLRCFAGIAHWQCSHFPMSCSCHWAHSSGTQGLLLPRTALKPQQSIPNPPPQADGQNTAVHNITFCLPQQPSSTLQNRILQSCPQGLTFKSSCMCLYHDNDIFQKPQLAIISSFSISLSEANNFYVGCVWQRYNETKKA